MDHPSNRIAILLEGVLLQIIRCNTTTNIPTMNKENETNRPTLTSSRSGKRSEVEASSEEASSKAIKKQKTDDYAIVRPANDNNVNESDKKEACRFCGEQPCVIDANESAIYEGFLGLLEYFGDADNLLPEEIRFRLYRYASSFLHGTLGSGNRKKLPQCVMTEIRDLAPSKTGYVGFKK